MTRRQAFLWPMAAAAMALLDGADGAYHLSISLGCEGDYVVATVSDGFKVDLGRLRFQEPVRGEMQISFDEREGWQDELRQHIERLAG